MSNFSVAIDGPAGAGKSTIAKQLAKKLSYIYIDTGAMYRAIGFYVYSHVFKDNSFEINEVTQRRIEVFLDQHLSDLKVSIDYIGDEQHIFLNEEDITFKIRTQEMGTMASVVSAIKSVREYLVYEQQMLASKTSVVMDGRDIGTHVLPNAQVKVYLTASSEIRARRRYNELIEKGMSPDFDQLKSEIEERDYRDMNREFAPLRQADDAVVIDSSTMTISEVVDCIYTLVLSKLN